MMSVFDEFFYLMGDEDTDVGLHCHKCDRGGAPVVFYTGDTRVTAYSASDVVVVHGITDLITAGKDHIEKHREGLKGR